MNEKLIKQALATQPPKQIARQLASLKDWRISTVNKIKTQYPTPIALIKGVSFFEILGKNISKSKKAIICTNEPLFYEIEQLYGNNTVIQLLATYLFNFQGLLNFKDENKLNDTQIQVCAINILPLVRGITITETVLMLNSFLTGEYGNFYGAIDIMIICQMVKKYKQNRSNFISKNKDVRNFIMKRDQNFDTEKIQWIENLKKNNDENKRE